MCRRAAEKELRHLRSQLQHFERVVDELRVNVAAFGRSARGADGTAATLDARRAAEDALMHAAGALTFAGEASDPFASELRALYGAVAPFFGR